MPKVRSMTGFAQVTGQVSEELSFTLSLKAVNHRFLDLHLRMPSETDALEMKLRRALKEKLTRGHVDVVLGIHRGSGSVLSINRELVGGYLSAFRSVAQEFGIAAEPDLNAILKMPGAMESGPAATDEALDAAVLSSLEQGIARLNDMREEEGRSIERELREILSRLKEATEQVEKLRSAVLHAYMDKVQSRMRELIGAHVDSDRILQEAAILAERSDIQEELVRMHTHIKHFDQLLNSGGEIGKKLDFLLQEMNREANTLLSKTSGVAGEALHITELGLALKSEIEKAREQVQNIE
jgi:uncharacterized protein (TIGR00255 family)